MSKKSKDVQLPFARIRTIMKSSPNTENVGQDAVFIMAKCTEMFIQYMTTSGFQKSSPGQLDYKGISEFVHSQPGLSYIHEIVPRKMTVRECMKRIKQAEQTERMDESDESTEEEESSEE